MLIRLTKGCRWGIVGIKEAKRSHILFQYKTCEYLIQFVLRQFIRLYLAF